MNERGLYLDLKRILTGALHRSVHHVYEVERTHRMHTVCGTLESLGYLRRIPPTRPELSAWSPNPEAWELFLDLDLHHYGRKG